MANKTVGPRVAFYGFDRAGFELPTTTAILKNGGEVYFLPFNDPRTFEEFDGVVVPQGIFEEIEYISGGYGPRSAKVYVDKDALLARERQVQNLLKERKWICFLVGAIVDEVPAGYDNRQITETDLCKRVLNGVGLNWMHRKLDSSGMTGVTSNYNEFHEYIRQHGVAKTYFEFPYGHKTRILAKQGDTPVGLDYYDAILFLPFHTTKKDQASLTNLGKILGTAILDYRQKQQAEVPEWAQAFRFSTEEELRTELDEALKNADELQARVQTWNDYKAVLTTSGDVLKERVVLVLEQFFGFKVDPLDEGREDAKLLGDKGEVTALVEVKGIKGGIRREPITQTDTHRERNELPVTIPGMLVINCQMDVPSIEKRIATTVDDEQVKYASQNNILIVRTTELLMLMRSLEKSEDRKAALLGLLNAGGGLLHVDEKGYSVIRK